MDIQTIILISSVVFGVSSVMFFALTASTKKELYSYAMIVSMITFVSSMLMFDGLLVLRGPAGDPLFFTRWIGYAFSCTLLAYTIAKHVALPQTYTVRLMYLTGIVMITGALASVTTGWTMLAYFVAGGFAYILMVLLLATKGEKSLGRASKYVFFGWSAFPLVFILSPEGYGLIGTVWSLWAYLVLDIATKIVFYIELAQQEQG